MMESTNNNNNNTSSIYDRVKVFDKPFAYILMNQKSESYCSNCLRRPDSLINGAKKPPKLQLCGNCRFARYCDKSCQRQAWKDHHKQECGRLKRVFPHLPVTEVLFLARIADKVKFIEKNGDTYEWQSERRFDQLMTHEKEIRECEEKMQHYQKIYEKMRKYYLLDGHDDDDSMKMEEGEFFLIFCRTWINSHSIHTNVGDEIGMALDLDVSRYDHSCRPNTTLVFDGYRAMMRPLAPTVDAKNYKRSFIAYVDVGRSKYQRRKELYAKWFFHCECERCLDPDDDKLTSMKCPNPEGCPEPVVITEDCEPADTTKCPKCGATIGKDAVVRAQALMNSIPAKFNMTSDEHEIDALRKKLDEAREILHEENIYYCRLMTAYMQMTGGKDEVITNPDIQRLVYQNYRRFLPQSDRHIGYQLLHLVKSLIEKGRRSEAVQYAYEAMTIFEVCFGLEHPYYLQTLALWTYLDQRVPKSDQELLQLMNFNYNRPVDLSSLLSKAMSENES